SAQHLMELGAQRRQDLTSLLLSGTSMPSVGVLRARVRRRELLFQKKSFWVSMRALLASMPRTQLHRHAARRCSLILPSDGVFTVVLCFIIRGGPVAAANARSGCPSSLSRG